MSASRRRGVGLFVALAASVVSASAVGAGPAGEVHPAPAAASGAPSGSASASPPMASASAAPSPSVTPSSTPPLALPPAKPVPIKLPKARAGRPLQWDPQWRRFEASDWVVTGAAGAIVLATAIVKPLPPAIHGGVLFDDSVRNSLRLGSIDARGTAGDTSDVLLSVMVMSPFLIDSLATAWWYRGSKDVAQQMALIDIETMAIAGAAQGALAMVTGRERPYGRDCGGELPNSTIECDSFSRFRSYFSGHTTLTFTSASLICSHHLNQDLFENGAADEIICFSAMAAAAATGTLRIMSDYHYATDVATGALVGLGIGFGVPYFAHYRRRANDDNGTKTTTTFSLSLVPNPFGMTAVGTF